MGVGGGVIPFDVDRVFGRCDHLLLFIRPSLPSSQVLFRLPQSPTNAGPVYIP